MNPAQLERLMLRIGSTNVVDLAHASGERMDYIRWIRQRIDVEAVERRIVEEEAAL